MRALITLTFLVSAALISASAQLGPSTDLPEEPQVFNEAGQQFRVVPIHGLEQPWALAFLPSGDILVTERRGRLRIVRDGMLDPEPIAGIPEVTPSAIGSGLMDVAVHPEYAENQYIYFTYSKPMPGNPHEDYRDVTRRHARWRALGMTGAVLSLTSRISSRLRRGRRGPPGHASSSGVTASCT